MTARPLRIMVVDEHRQRADALARALTGLGYQVVGQVPPSGFLPQQVSDLDAEVILIDVDAPNRDTLEQVHAVSRQTPRPIVMLTPRDDPHLITEAIRAGVSAYVVDGLNHSRVKAVIDTAIAQFRRYQELQSELERTRASLNERKVIDRAKGVLMAHRGLTEPEAYRLLQKMAMDRKMRIPEVARDIIEMSALFQPASRPQ